MRTLMAESILDCGKDQNKEQDETKQNGEQTSVDVDKAEEEKELERYRFVTLSYLIIIMILFL